MILWRVAMLAGIAVSPAAAHAARPQAGSAEASFVRARAAELIGRADVAAAGYAAALAAAPGDPGLALRAFRQALAAGDFALAARTAATLQARRALPEDGELFLFADAVRRKDWAAADRAIAAIGQQEVFGFLLPTLRAWLAFGTGSADPLALIDQNGGGLAGAYASEHRALIQLASGRLDDGLASIRVLASGSEARQARLRLVAAAALQRARRKDDALAVLVGNDSATAAGRALVARGKPIPAPIMDASAGLAELFARLAVDVGRERATPLTLSLARLGTYLAPDNSETWLVVSEVLSTSRQIDAALAALNQIRPDDPFAEYARTARVDILSRAGRQDAALAEALKMAGAADAKVGDWVRVADIYRQMERHRESADAYGRALALAEKGGEDRWALWLLRGGAREQAGQWPEAKADLQKAAALAPEEPTVLNYLGYAQIERRENLAEARRLVEKASQLRPDDAAITDSLGWAYYLDGEIAKAVELLERAVAAEPGEPTINEHLGDAYWASGRRREARFAWRAALIHAEAADAKRISAKIDAGLSPAVAAP